MRLSPLTKRRLRTAIASIDAHLAGEEGEGDLADTPFSDLRAARESLAARLGEAPEREPLERPSASVLRGLATVMGLANVDIQASFPADFPGGEREDALAALAWIDDVLTSARAPRRS